MNKNLSVFIIAKNEADRIGRSIISAQKISDEIIVVDSGSTDNTIDIAKSLGAITYFNEWPGYGLQKQFAEDKCTREWMLNIDADEVISDELASSILAELDKNSQIPAGYKIKIIEAFPGEAIPPSWSYSLDPVRLYHKKAGRYNPSTVHDRVDMNKGIEEKPIRGSLYHYSIRDFGGQLRKLDSYTEDQSEDLLKRGKKMPVFRLFTEFPLSFFKAYFIRRYCFRGISGFSYSVLFAFYRFARIAKYFEKSKTRKTGV